MDAHYDKESARETVELFAASRMKLGDIRIGLDGSEQTPLSVGEYLTLPISRPKSWKFTKVDERGDGCDEVTLCLQGILCHKDLPPFTGQEKMDRKRRRFLRQSLSITSFGGPAMDKSIKLIQEIHHLMSRTFPENQMDDWKPGFYQDYPTVDMANRYMTDRHDMGNVNPIDIPASVDPKGELTKLMGEEYVHLPENQVTYFEHVKCDGKYSNRRIAPIAFRTGDIVEAQFTFSVVTILRKRYKMLLTLRSLMLLDTEPLRQASTAKIQQQSDNPRMLTIKRKRAYEDDDEDEMNGKTARMVLK